MTEFNFDQHRQEQDTSYATILLRDYFEIDSEIQALEATQKDIRKSIETLTIALGGNVKIAHIGTALVTESSTSHAYDTKAIDALLLDLISLGELHTAKRIMECKKETTRAGGLRITKAK
jgi:hypothetical protein